MKAVEDTLLFFGAPVYVKHEIVHNKHVVADIKTKGAITIEKLSDVPDGAVVVFSAHGSPPEHYVEAKRRNLRLIDATCPLVTKVHLEVHHFFAEGYDIVYIGHRGHVEGIGVLGESAAVKEKTKRKIILVETVGDVQKLDIGNPKKLVYLSQTTLSVDDTQSVIEALKKKYPQIIAPPLKDICYATTNRQQAVKGMARAVDLVFILGSKNSSNSTRLMETARSGGVKAYLIDDVLQVDTAWLENAEIIGISAGASAPEKLVQEVVEYFTSRGAEVEDFIMKPETMKFSEPLELMKLRSEMSKTKCQINNNK